MQAMEANEIVDVRHPQGRHIALQRRHGHPRKRARGRTRARFINFVHAPEDAAANRDYVWYLAPKPAAYPLMSEEMRDNPRLLFRRRCGQKRSHPRPRRGQRQVRGGLGRGQGRALTPMIRETGISSRRTALPAMRGVPFGAVSAWTA